MLKTTCFFRSSQVLAVVAQKQMENLPEAEVLLPGIGLWVRRKLFVFLFVVGLKGSKTCVCYVVLSEV